LAAVTAVVVLILVLTARRKKPRGLGAAARGSGRRAPAGERSTSRPRPTGGGRRWPCPLCGELLGPGERIRSVIRLSPKDGRVMEISGCPHCLPPAQRRRTCPVCKAEVGPDEVLTARVFDRSRDSGKPHVHVLGCDRCRG
ncbi:MAG TPA: hypothetical protein VMQ10_02945, partial [Spirochaetia bacterium]|nr:hypothetical protein [Spirochaetia bacterium]